MKILRKCSKIHAKHKNNFKIVRESSKNVLFKPDTFYWRSVAVRVIEGYRTATA